MIYFNNKLMPDSNSARLFMVTNPVPFEEFHDHEAAIFIRIHDLVEEAIESGENPVALIEDYLEIDYTDGQAIEEISNFLFYMDKMQSALWTLKENWSDLDKTLPEDSLMYSVGMDKDDAIQTYSETTLRSYLEALAQNKND